MASHEDFTPMLHVGEINPCVYAMNTQYRIIHAHTWHPRQKYRFDFQ